MDQLVSYIQYIQDQLEIAKACNDCNTGSANVCYYGRLYRGELQRIDRERAKSGPTFGELFYGTLDYVDRVNKGMED